MALRKTEYGEIKKRVPVGSPFDLCAFVVFGKFGKKLHHIISAALLPLRLVLSGRRKLFLFRIWHVEIELRLKLLVANVEACLASAASNCEAELPRTYIINESGR